MPSTPLTRTVALLYSMQDSDRDALYGQILAQRVRAWDTALRQLIGESGYDIEPRELGGDDFSRLQEMSRADAVSIVKTWNRDVTRQIERLYEQNPRGNRQYYYSNLERWNTERNRWKLPQIALVTDTTTTEYARQRWREENYRGDEGYVFDGPAPTCEDCVRRFAAGIVDRRYVRRFPTPRHIGCPHTWRAVRPPTVRRGRLWHG